MQIRTDSETSVDAQSSQRSVRFANPAHSRSLGDVTTCVTLPRRKPVLNFGSVSREVSENEISAPYTHSANRPQDLDRRYDPSNGFSTITRAHSFKDGLDLDQETPAKGPSLTRAQSLYDGLDSEFGESSNGSKLNRAPSVDEILESVKFLRAKKNGMVKSSPDLLLQMSQEKSHHHSSRHKTGGSKSTKNTSTSTTEPRRSEKSKKPLDQERTLNPSDEHCYENIGGRGSQYENVSCIKRTDVIYDSPKSSKVVSVEKPHRGGKRPQDELSMVSDHYETLDFDPLYENINDNEPTYMNVSCSKRPGKDPAHSYQSKGVYTNVEETECSTRPSSRKGKQVNSLVYEDHTYDIPKAATHIYDTPAKQAREVCPQPTSKKKSDGGDNTYDTPHNNRAVLPQSSQILLKAKNEQIRKIEDIFADCEKDSLDGDANDANSSPDIPSPGEYIYNLKIVLE